ncbi:MAG: molybdate ABC transporter substrate-binding protein [Candidatus Schekmanbacteria bacterium]|nr:molybdate ABC transporter substrate-binding protein [Candidatus Schekmanbacteria bacterium]
MKFKISILIFFILCSSIPFLVSADDSYIEVFCGSAVKPAIEEIAAKFKEDTGIAVNLHIGSSGVMLSELKLAKRGDIYIPGSNDFLLKAERDGVVEKGNFKVITYLIPSIVVPSLNPQKVESLKDLARPGIKVLIGNPESVCLGVYALEILKENGIYEKVKPNIITYAESCEKVASIVAMGNVDAAIGWSVFEKWNHEKIKSIPLKQADIKRLAFVPAALTTFTEKKNSALRFINFLSIDHSLNILRKMGYSPTLEDVKAIAPYANIGGEYKVGDY